MTAAGIILATVSAITLVSILWMFLGLRARTDTRETD
jgi:hypothetical protein